MSHAPLYGGVGVKAGVPHTHGKGGGPQGQEHLRLGGRVNVVGLGISPVEPASLLNPSTVFPDDLHLVHLSHTES